MPGIHWRDSSGTRFSGQFGWNPKESIRAIYLQGFFPVGKHIILNPAYLYLHFADPQITFRHEHGLMPAVIVHFRIKRWLIEDRNLFWNRIRTNAPDINIYRNRLKIIHPIPGEKVRARVYFFDEAFFLFGENRWIRNRLAIGFTADIYSRFNIDAFYVWQQNRAQPSTTILFVMVSFILRPVAKKETNRQ
ncbi:MAG: DUF2490 domain-containing protein [Chitinophagaceae bacterium]